MKHIEAIEVIQSLLDDHETGCGVDSGKPAEALAHAIQVLKRLEGVDGIGDIISYNIKCSFQDREKLAQALQDYLRGQVDKTYK
jgi:hypothetical protein